MQRTFLSVVLTLTCAAANAQFFDPDPVQRAGSWETTFGLYINGEESSNGENGSSLDVDTGYGLGVSIGYNFTANLALRFDASWARPDYQAVVNSEEEGLLRVDHELSVFNGQFNGVWNILDSAFTPYLQAGIGWTYLDSNVAEGPPQTGCWWDPWWGYICDNFYSTYSDSNFSWNVGAGLRYEFGHSMFVRGGWERTEIDGSKNGANPDFDAFRFELGWFF